MFLKPSLTLSFAYCFSGWPCKNTSTNYNPLQSQSTLNWLSWVRHPPLSTVVKMAGSHGTKEGDLNSKAAFSSAGSLETASSLRKEEGAQQASA